jgi:hypothetical protein
MPTPPFSQDRRDWLEELVNAFKDSTSGKRRNLKDTQRSDKSETATLISGKLDNVRIEDIGRINKSGDDTATED